MKIYNYFDDGYSYLGVHIIIISENEKDAIPLIKEELKKLGVYVWDTKKVRFDKKYLTEQAITSHVLLSVDGIA